MDSADAVVIGAGPNGLVAANMLADRGWDVLVLEATGRPGGAVQSAEVTARGYVNDLFSAFYPLGYASPVMAGLGLEEYGLGGLAHALHDAAAAAARALPAAGAAIEWTVTAAASGVVGLLVGAALIPFVEHVAAPLWQRLRGGGAGGERARHAS